jgi:hypothetical protein
VTGDERWLTDTRKILLIQLLTVVLTPISVALTFYLVQHSKAPKPKIQYVTASPGYFVAEPSSSLLNRINDEPGLASDFRKDVREASSTADNSQSCTAWLDGGPWDSDCLAAYKSASNGMRGLLRAVIAEGHGSVQESRAKSGLRIVEDLRKELIAVENAKQSRAGNVTLTVGVLNTGDLNGTIFSDSLLKFDNKTMHVSADRYTEVDGHGFSEVVFTTAREEDGKFWGSFRTGEEPTIKTWSDLVKTGKEISFELTIILNDKRDLIKGTVVKE